MTSSPDIVANNVLCYL